MTLTLTLETLAERVERLERTIEQLAMSSEDVLSLNQQAFEKSKADLQARFSSSAMTYWIASILNSLAKKYSTENSVSLNWFIVCHHRTRLDTNARLFKGLLIFCFQSLK